MKIHATKNWLGGVAGLLLAAFVVPGALAAPPKTLKVTKWVVIEAPPKQVWAQVKDFDSLHKWHPAFSGDQIVKGTNNTVGAVRKLTLKDGGSFTEELKKYNEDAQFYTYSIVESALPLTDYEASLDINPGSKHGTTSVKWEATFKRKAETPKPNETDEAAKKLIEGVFQAGLANLKKVVETPAKKP